MTLFALIFALVLEQARPLHDDNPAHVALRAWAAAARRWLDAGQWHHGWLAWALAVLGPVVLAVLIYGLLNWVHGLLGFAWAVLVLYLTLGFRQFSHHFTTIRVALESGDEAAARAELARWQGVEVAELPQQELLRHVIEHSVLAAHRHVFGVMVAFVVFAAIGLGPAGAVLYRMALHAARHWPVRTTVQAEDASAAAARRGWHVVDYVPVRATALAFAVVGNFEEAIANWRQDGALTKGNDGLLLAASAGAMNVRLGSGPPLGEPLYTPELGWSESDARVPQLAHLASMVGLVWRGVLLWLLLLALALFARAW